MPILAILDTVFQRYDDEGNTGILLLLPPKVFNLI